MTIYRKARRARFVRFQGGNPGREDARALAQRIFDFIQQQTGGGAHAALPDTVKRTFDESRVRRHPAGTPVGADGAGGGRFAPRGGAGAAQAQREDAGSAPDADTVKKQAGALADAIMRDAAEAEPRVTGLLQEIAEARDGELWGLDFRLKQKDSLVRKIVNDTAEKGISTEKAAGEINDSLRYTMIFNEGNFVDGATDVLGRLADAGFTQYDHKFKNFWKPGNSYRGYNCVFVNEESGLKFELQFHTPRSINVKGESHKLYEQARVTQDRGEKARLEERMRNLWDTIAAPSRWELLPGAVIGR